MAGQPTFSAECTEAFNLMNTQESPNDFFVCGFDGNSHNLKLVEAGRGGMARVKEILSEQFSDNTAVAMFRVTAVDDRENTVSYRTKLIHVIYTGPNTPVMKRAKIGPFNSAFKQPFTFNLSVQTSDEDGDLNEAAIEKSLRASGGAHQPTHFDFANAAAGAGSEKKIVRSPAQSPAVSSPKASPAPKQISSPTKAQAKTLTVEEVFDRHGKAFDARDPDALAADYADDSVLTVTDAGTRQMTIYTGGQAIASYYQDQLWPVVAGDVQVIKVETQGNVKTIEWAAPSAGIAFAVDVFHILNGKIVVQAITSVPTSGDALAASAEAPEEAYDVADVAEEDPQTEEAAPEGSAEWEAVEQEDAVAAEETQEDAGEDEPATEADIPVDEAPEPEIEAATEEAEQDQWE